MLRLTQEADNALRVMFLLAKSGECTDAPTLATHAGIAPSFALKILRKLKEGELLDTVKGARGGYYLIRPPDRITVLQIVELIDGPLYRPAAAWSIVCLPRSTRALPTNWAP